MPGLTRKIGPEAVRFVGAVARYRANPLAAAQRYWTLYRHRRFSPDEIHFQRLLDPALSAADLERAVSKEELLTVQARLNPREWHARTEDKACFHEFCLKAGLPIPNTFGLFDRMRPSAGAAWRVLQDVTSVDAFLRDLAADAFVLKPVEGVNGEGVMRLERDGTKWRDTRGEAFDAASVVALIERSHYRRWMFQEVIAGHPELRALSDTTGLQTVRVVTVIDQNGDVQILAARLRLICGNVAHDNFEFGKTGNVIALLDPREGTIQSAVGGARERYEIRPVTHHPSTGRRLIGFSVPGWEAVRKLAIDAARAFQPLRCIGWDVAVTPGRPGLIEGNVTWATLSGDPRMGDIYRYLKALADSMAAAR